MKQAIPSLLLLLVIQCAMIFAVHWPVPGPKGTGTSADDTVGSLASAQVEELIITNDSGEHSHLKKVGEHWLISDLELPAESDRVSQLIETLLSPPLDWPIASSETAQKRFEVAPQNFQRRIQLLGESRELTTIYLGTSPGFRKVHARHSGDMEVHSIKLNVFEVAATDGDWIDPHLLRVRTPVGITADTYSLHRNSGQWLAGNGSVPDKRELEALLSTLRSLQVEGIAEPDTVAALSEHEAELVLHIEGLSGPITLELFELQGAYFIRSSEYAPTFKLGRYQFELLTGIDDLRIAGHLTD